MKENLYTYLERHFQLSYKFFLQIFLKLLEWFFSFWKYLEIKSTRKYFYLHCFTCIFTRDKNMFFSSPSYYIRRTLLIVQIFHFRFLADLHVLASGESKKYKISMVSGCLLVSILVSMLVSMLVCYTVETISFEQIVAINFVPVLK